MGKGIVEKILKISGFSSLNPMQKSAVEKGLLEGKNLVVAAPTASGKTLLCELAAYNLFMNNRGKMVYLAPLVALVSEKYHSFRQKYSRDGIKIAMSVGDLDSSDPWLADYDWVLTSNEKCDSLIRHGAHWVKDIGLIVVDEIHLLQDPSRGPTLEITLTRLREVVPHAQILALSATIHNVKELANWLNAKAVISDYRPVELHEGIYVNSKIQFFGRDGYELDGHLAPELSIIDNTRKLGKQALFFVSTRRSAESLAEKLGGFYQNYLERNEKEQLKKLSQEVISVLEIPTRQCKRLASCIKNGIAFHHAGLLFKQKKLIEDNFRLRTLRTIVATPTLCLGVNLPAFRVIIRDAKRYYGGYGASFIPVLEYKQFCGRAGRPDYDEFGESILMAKSEDEAQELTERFILGEPEDIHSKLALEPVLRMHTLALIASDFVNTRESLMKFFGKTFYAHQHGDTSAINQRIEDIIQLLVNFKFLTEKEGKISATRIGKRVSELYIDPLTAHHLIKSLSRAMKIRPQPFSYLHMIANTIEMRPFLSVGSKEFEEVNSKIVSTRFLQKVPKDDDLEFDDFLKSVKTAMMLEGWMNEMTEDQILSRFRVTPGELRTRLNNADWLLYASQELALLLGFKEILKDLRKIRVRVMYGVKEELIPLVRLEQIGRIRSRKLYNAGLKTISDLRKIPLTSLERIIGPKIAAIVKKQLGEKVEEIKEEKQTTLKKV
ncbi:MAG: DEAD/DEAH box helicase [Candidatus Aenigmarchaeota archaeon]|nr:DEAD/DEAH box helicase [Candidatus Aenigmarchaeota archaeon]